MRSGEQLDVSLLCGATELLEIHRRELPQRDDLCGAFCAALAFGAAGIAEFEGEPLDQDAIALAAASTVARVAQPSSLPRGERGRRDYRLSLPLIDDGSASGTTAAGLMSAVQRLSGGRLAAIPYAGPWSVGTLAALFEAAASLQRPVTLVANLATSHLWGSHAGLQECLRYLHEGGRDGPAPDWEVGHFVCLIGRVRGPVGSLYVVADTYGSLGREGVHVQPQERLAAAIERREQPAGGVIVIASVADAPAVRAAAGAAGLLEGAWDNGSVTPEMSR